MKNSSAPCNGAAPRATITSLLSRESWKHRNPAYGFFLYADLFAPLNATFITCTGLANENKNKQRFHFFSLLFFLNYATSGCLKFLRFTTERYICETVYEHHPPIDTNVHGFHEFLDRVSLWGDLYRSLSRPTNDSKLMFVC